MILVGVDTTRRGRAERGLCPDLSDGDDRWEAWGRSARGIRLSFAAARGNQGRPLLCRHDAPLFLPARLVPTALFSTAGHTMGGELQAGLKWGSWCRSGSAPAALWRHGRRGAVERGAFFFVLFSFFLVEPGSRVVGGGRVLGMDGRPRAGRRAACSYRGRARPQEEWCAASCRPGCRGLSRNSSSPTRRSGGRGFSCPPSVRPPPGALHVTARLDNVMIPAPPPQDSAGSPVRGPTCHRRPS